MSASRVPRPSYANVVATVALLIALCGAGIPQAAAAGLKAAFATNAGAVDGLSAAKTPKAGQLLALNTRRRFPASVLDLSGVYSRPEADARFRAKDVAVDAATLNGATAASFLGATAQATDADKLDGLDSTAFRKASDNVDAATLNGWTAVSFLGATAKAADADKLDGYDSSTFRKVSDLVDASTLNGATAASLLGASAKAADADQLDGLDGSAFRKVTDPVDASTLNGATAASFLGASGKAADANKLDGLDSTDFRKVADPVNATTFNGFSASAFVMTSGKASDSDKLDGLDSTDFLRVSGKAADANFLDGIDSSGFTRTTTQFQYSSSTDFTGIERFRPQAMPYRTGQASTGGASIECLMGSVMLFAGNFSPSGYLPAQGQLLPIQQNVAMFSLLGTTYGGDGVSNFALADMHGLAPAGAEYHVCVNGAFPMHP